ncbi:LysE family translocator [Sutterella sp.]|uniref:LysE family translocator n=1 Tax=Sutterella sp. TaxID=1981025 RepID=UPI0026E04D80|nr:LysE family translocator [Sutterella sp.]MDO5532366.1 LysE family translocator [Sutterella sp.]
MTTQNFSVFLFITIATVLTPGAGVLCTISNALRHGARHVFASPAGNCIGATLIAYVCAAGLGAVITASPVLFSALQTCSALLLLWLGWRSWTAKPTDFSKLDETQALEAPDAKRTKSVNREIFCTAALLQGTNPMLYVYVLSLLPQFIDPQGSYTSQAMILTTVFGVVVFLGHVLWSFTVVKARRFLKGERASMIMNRICATLFALLAASVLWDTAVHIMEKSA